MSIFDDLAGLPDETEISLGDKTIKLGDLKSEYTNERTQREQIAQERDRFRSEHESLAGSVAKLLGAAGAGAERDANNPPQPVDYRGALRDAMQHVIGPEDPTNALFEDKLFGRALKTVEDRAYERATAENKKTMESLKAMEDMMNKGFQGLAGAQVVERESRWYDVNRSEIPTAQNGKKVSLQELRDYCDRNGMYIQGTQLRDFDRAVDTLTAPTRQEALLKAERDKAFQEGLNAGRSASAKVIPLIGERNGGGMPKGDYSTNGKSARQIVSERLQQGLSDLSNEANEG